MNERKFNVLFHFGLQVQKASFLLMASGFVSFLLFGIMAAARMIFMI